MIFFTNRNELNADHRRNLTTAQYVVIIEFIPNTASEIPSALSWHAPKLIVHQVIVIVIVIVIFILQQHENIYKHN